MRDHFFKKRHFSHALWSNKEKQHIMKTDNINMEGQGLLDNLKSLVKHASPLGTNLINLIPTSDNNARPLYQGEKHSLLKLPNGKMAVANFQGPGTRLLERLKRKDPPRTATDTASLAHDIRYGLADNVDDIRRADNIMIKKVNQISNNKSDSRFNIAQARLIKAKIVGENLGLIKRDAFSGDLSVNKLISKEDKELMEKTLKPLEMKGYGSPIKDLKRKARSAVVKQKGSGLFRMPKPLAKGETASIMPLLGDIGKLAGTKLLLPIAGAIIAGKSAKAISKKIFPWIKKKLGFGGSGLKNSHEQKLMDELEKGIVKVKSHMEKGQTILSLLSNALIFLSNDLFLPHNKCLL
jgi:hypothetical protein